MIVSGVKYLSFSPSDRTDWHDMGSALWPDHTVSDLEQVFDDLLTLKHYQGYMCRLESGEAVGFIFVSLRRDYVEGSSSSPVGYIEGIYVKPKYREQGIAKTLSERGEEWSFEHGCKEMASDAYWDNNESREFHKHIGYEETERIVHFIKPIKNADSRNESA